MNWRCANEGWRDLCAAAERKESFGATLAEVTSICLSGKGRGADYRGMGRWKQSGSGDIVPLLKKKRRRKKKKKKTGQQVNGTQEALTEVERRAEWVGERNRQRALSCGARRVWESENWWVHLGLIIAMMDRIADFPQRRLNDSLTQIWATGFTSGVH